MGSCCSLTWKVPWPLVPVGNKDLDPEHTCIAAISDKQVSKPEDVGYPRYVEAIAGLVAPE